MIKKNQKNEHSTIFAHISQLYDTPRTRHIDTLHLGPMLIGRVLAQLGTTMPTIELPAAARSERLLTDIAATGKLFGSRKEAKRSVKAGGFYVNDMARSSDGFVADADVLHGEYTVLRKGKKSHLMIRWTA